ncbi:MAG: ribosome maturation factor RimM [Chloroflexota bacterium]|nr:ribosome maturation factor RimM [Chloroflexota bacterium]MDE2683365.1 ribosome maturation factor RimM [Chloroflexota bacterium]
MSKRPRSRRYAKPAPSRSRNSEPAPDTTDDTVIVGRIIRSHGLDGSLRIQSLSDNPARFQAGSALTVAGQTRTVVSCHPLPDGHALLRLEGLNDLYAARCLSGEWLIAPTDSDPQLPHGEYYHYQLVGLTVITDEGEDLGTIQEVLETGSNDVYVVTSDSGEEVLLPAIEQVVKEIDLASGKMLVHLLHGLR